MSPSADDHMTFYECTLELGWGVAGPVLRGVQAAASRCAVVLDPFPFATLAPVRFVPIKARGNTRDIKLFEQYMRDHGLHPEAAA